MDKPIQAPGKLRPPRYGRVLPRTRLFDALDTMSANRGIWIYGPPGIGKTTLVATYLDARATQCLWLQLDASDDDAAAFVQLLSIALNDAIPTDTRVLAVPSEDDLRDVSHLLWKTFQLVGTVLESPWVLVLDNAQEIGDNSILNSALAAVLAKLPDGVQIIFISRDPSPVVFSYAVATQLLGLIETEELCFSLAETDALVRLHHSKCAADELHRVTDGWPAAMILILASVGLKKTSPDMNSEIVRQRLFAYFAGEVLDRMPQMEVATLERLALLPSTTESMAVAFSGDAQAGRLLAGLADRSLFTHRRGQHESVYSFHVLFSDYLRVRLAARLSAQQLLELRLLATRLLIENGQIDEAIVELIAVGAWDSVVDVLNEHAARYLELGRRMSLMEWIDKLPQSHRMGASMHYWFGVCISPTNPAAAIQEFKQALHGFTMTSGGSELFYTAAAACDAIVALGERLDQLESWINILEVDAAGYVEGHSAGVDLRVLPGLLAAFVHCRTNHPLTSKLVDLAEKMMDEPRAASQRILLGTTALYLLWTGQLVRLARFMAKLDRLCEIPDAATLTLMRWYGIGIMIRSLLGQSDEAQRDAQIALTLAKDNHALLPKAHLQMALAAISARDARLARKHLRTAESIIKLKNAIDITTYEFQQGLLYLLEGNTVAAHRVMKEAVVSGRESGWPLREHIAIIGCAMTATETGNFEEAERSLNEAITHPFYIACLWHQWIAALAEANLADRQGDLQRKIRALGRAFGLCAEYGFDFGPLPYSCGYTMSRLCSAALRHGIGTQQVSRIIQRYVLPAPAEADEHWPWPIKIQTLGHFAILLNDEPLQRSRKESPKAFDLLKLVITFGGRKVPTQRLSTLLWPDADGIAARNSFENTVHRLRKLLGEHHLIVQSGTLSLNPDTCWVDVAALERSLKSTSFDETENAAALAGRVLTLYQGAFLAGEDQYLQFTSARARLQSLFIRRIEGIGEVLDADGQFDASAAIYRRVLEQDPLAERIYRRLIVCLLRLDQPAEAFDVYRRCRQQLSVLLNIQPSAETEALVAALRRR